MDKKVRAEYLRSPETVCQPDPRNDSYESASSEVAYRDGLFKNRHQSIDAIRLHGGIPEDIVIQFETAKNIYLYAWFVYRFYPVAESQAYVCLEFALRERLEQEMLHAGWEKRPHGFGLRHYLNYASRKGYIQNEDFEVWRRRVLLRARGRHLYESIEEMQRLDLTEMSHDESKIEINDEDRAYDYLGIIVDSIPKLRNHYAHGSKQLHNQVQGTFQIVSEIVNKLWPNPAGN